MAFLETWQRKFIVSSIEKSLRLGVLGVGLLASCSSTPPGSVAPDGAPSLPQPTVVGSLGQPGYPLGPPGPVRNWAEVRMQAAHRLMAANPNDTYAGPVVEPLLGIPVLEIELNGDGSVRRIVVLRHPQEAKEVSKLAEDAVRRAAPFGDVSRLPKPWRFVETFLFNDERKFKPRSLD
jgi:hypothetical protein